MQNIWHDMDSSRITAEDFMCVIEIPEGSKAKYELDKQSGLLKLDRILYTSTHYPANYGFIPRTYADDLDPLDVLVLCSEKIYPLTLVECYPIGYITMLDNGRNDYKIIAIPFNDPTYNTYTDIAEIPKHIFDEMTHFFSDDAPFFTSAPVFSLSVFLFIIPFPFQTASFCAEFFLIAVN